MQIKATILDETAIQRIITRLSHEILEHNNGSENIILMGMRTRGEFVAKRIAAKIREIEKKDVPLAILDVTLYRDDFRTNLKQPTVSVSNITSDITGKDVILIDDVLYTGRTVRSALCAIMEFGRPATIQLCCLVDRGHRELPIRADYVGKNTPTSVDEEIKLKMKEIDNEDAVYLVDSSSLKGEA